MKLLKRFDSFVQITFFISPDYKRIKYEQEEKEKDEQNTIQSNYEELKPDSFSGKHKRPTPSSARSSEFSF